LWYLGCCSPKICRDQKYRDAWLSWLYGTYHISGSGVAAVVDAFGFAAGKNNLILKARGA
jgi:hypothetical protein